MNIRYGNTYELIQLSAIGTNCTRRKTSRSMGLWNKPERRFLARGFMPRKPVDRRRAERDSSGLPSGNIDLKQRKDWSIWADKMISSRGIYTNWKFEPMQAGKSSSGPDRFYILCDQFLHRHRYS